MSDRMQPIPFAQLLDWVLQEKERHGTVFGVRKLFHWQGKRRQSWLDSPLELPFGPAAGPHTQLAQNIAAAYAAGARFFELKTVQVLDGKNLHVDKPCIYAQDEGYNVEWSTELTVEQAFAEYVKAWYLLQVISREWHLGAPDGFIFNMSVGYDLQGIQSAKIDRFLEGMKDAADTEIDRVCRTELLARCQAFQHFTAEEIGMLTPRIASSITLSTMHGCKAEEIEAIAAYLLTKKHLHTFIKCNPTLLGYDAARRMMARLGYDYLVFDERHFREDLHFTDAVLMLHRLQKLAHQEGLRFGVKLTNTFPVEIAQEELPGQEMYMSGRALFPLTISVAERLAKAFAGQLAISYSGGADAGNIRALVELGMGPVTLATNLLKPGGYERLHQLAAILADHSCNVFQGVDITALHRMAKDALEDVHYQKGVQPLFHKKKQQAPVFDCFLAPCRTACPLHQDIPAYLQCAAEGRPLEAMRIITQRNPLPFITGMACYHACMSQCMRNFYDAPVNIRGVKLAAAMAAFPALLAEQSLPVVLPDRRAAVIGGGPAGLAAGYFLARAGWQVEVFEKQAAFGGMICKVVPELRPPSQAVENDLAWIKRAGVTLTAQTEKISVQELLHQGFAVVVLAIGAWKPKRRVDTDFYQKNGIQTGRDGLPVVQPDTLATSCPGVYAIGDGCHGPGGVAAALADALKCAEAISGIRVGGWPEEETALPAAAARMRHGHIMTAGMAVRTAAGRQGEASPVEKYHPDVLQAGAACLGCAVSCEVCAEVCPNRANIVIEVPGERLPQIVHLDGLCNACGNCAVFCPYEGAPYRDKLTLFGSEAAFRESSNPGFYCLDTGTGAFLLRLDTGTVLALQLEDKKMPARLQRLLRTLLAEYAYLFYAS